MCVWKIEYESQVEEYSDYCSYCIQRVHIVLHVHTQWHVCIVGCNTRAQQRNTRRLQLQTTAHVCAAVPVSVCTCFCGVIQFLALAGILNCLRIH